MEIRDRTWAKISLKNIENNFNNIKSYAKTKVLAIVKADAYGHGMIEVAHTLERQKADYFGVSTVNEAVTLRNSRILTPILMLGFFLDSEIKLMLDNDITFTIFDIETARNLSKTALSLNKTAKIHIKVDTGMSRLGFNFSENCKEIVKEIFSLPNIYIEGIFSHLSAGDDINYKDFTLKQVENFKNLLLELKNNGISIEIAHISASGAILNFPEFNFDMVRAGIILYGYYPNENIEKNIKLTPAMTLYSKIAQVKTLKTGQSVSYSLKYTATEDMKIAVATIGYADGYFRGNSNISYALCNGQKAKILGSVCMDMCMVDVTGIENVKKGDDIVIFGHDGETLLGADTVAKFTDTISYEILCAVSKRVPRVY